LKGCQPFFIPQKQSIISVKIFETPLSKWRGEGREVIFTHNPTLFNLILVYCIAQIILLRMRKIILLSIAVLFSFTAFSQDQSNKGRDFWFAYPAHNAGTTSRLAIYLTSDVNSSGTVTFNGNTINFVVTANQTTIVRISGATTPSNASCYIGSNNTIEINRGIRIQATNPVAAYAHILNAAVSGSTLLLPVNVLGKDYVVASHVPQGSTAGIERCQFVIVGVENNTTVEITPTNADISGTRVANVPFQINLNEGDVYQFQSNNELSGSTVKSIANGGNSCQKIVVIGSTTRSAIGCPNPPFPSPSSGDNLFQQLPPKSAWGKRYLTSPFINRPADKIRVFVSNPLTPVTVNGTPLPIGTLISNSYYEFNANTPQDIYSADPIAVYQYIYTQNCGGAQSDPEMIFINPVEQTIKDISFVSAERTLTPPNTNITSHFLNLILKNTGTSITSLRVDGVSPAVTFNPIGVTGYSYATIDLTLSTTPASPDHRVFNDSGFIAIAYGYGNVESYGYNAGTNVRDLNTKLEINNPNTDPSETEPSACTGSPFKFKVYFADSTNSLTALRYDSIKWEVLNNVTNFTPNNFPVMIRPIFPATTVGPDSVNIRNGKNVAWYSLPSFYTVSVAGTYNIKITLYRTSSEGCGNAIEFPFDLIVSDPPTASFTAPAPGCYLEPVVATETTPQIPKTTYKQWWEFYDPVTNVTTVYSNMNTNTPAIRSISHTFTTPGTTLTTRKRIRHVSITTPGCISDTITNYVELPDVPTATLTGNTTVCINSAPPPLTVNFNEGRAPWQFIYSINGVNQPPITTSSNPYIINAATSVANTFTYRLEEVRNSGSTVCVSTPINQTHTVIVQPDATVTLRAGDNANPTVCINNAIPTIRYDLGGTFTSATVGGLPTGVTFTQVGSVVTITGTPTVAGTFNYQILPVGPCLVPNPPVGGTITVNDDATIALQTANNNQTRCINTAIGDIDYLVAGGGTGATIAWTPSLPTGITFTPQGGGVFRIGGSSSVAGTFNYTVSTTGPCIRPTATGTLIIQPDATVTLRAGDNDNPTVCVNNAIPTIRYDLGGTFTSATVGGLPTGVTFTQVGSVVTITGTPTVAGTFNYQILPVGPCLVPNPPVGGTITVNDDATIALQTANNNQTRCINTAIGDIDYLVAGGGTGATIAWTPSLPTGITFTPQGGGVFRIGGSSSVAGTFNYTVSTTGPCIRPTATGTLIIQPDATVTLRAGDNANPTVCVNNAITNIRFDLGGTFTGATVTGLPTGIIFNTVGSVVTISGTPTIQGSFAYVVVPNSVCAVPNPAVGGTITVTGDATITLNAGSNNNQTVCRNIAITDIDYTIGGTATGATIAWAPSAPTGITFTPIGANGFKIAGTPTVVGTQTYTYTINTTGPCVNPPATGSITVNALPIASFTPPAIRCANSGITFTNTSTPNAASATYNWDFGDANTSTDVNPTHVYPIPNTAPGYTVTLTVTNANGCISNPIATAVVPVNDTPRAGFIVPEVCINDVATVFTDTSRINTGNTINGWFWNYGDPASGPANTATTQNGVHLYPAPNVYQVMHVAISNFGCRDTITQPITINSADPNAAFNILNRNTLCSSDSVDLQNISTVGFGNVTKLDIYWDNLGAPATFQTIDVPVFNGIIRHKYPTLQTNTNYQIRVVAYSGNVCFTSRIDNITVYANPVVQFNNIPPTCLLIAPFQITQGSEIGGVPGTGTYSGTGITNANGTFSPQVAGVGTHAIKYTFTASNPGACIDTLTRFITVIDTAQSLFTVSSPTCDGQAVTFTDNSDPRGNTLQTITWDFGHAPPNNTATSLPGAAITHIFPTYGFYDVRMFTTSSVGCLSTPSTIRIYVSPIPNPVFAPEKTSYCLPSESNVRFINNSTIADGTALTYSWNFDDPNATPSNPNTSTAVTPSHNYTSTGPFVVKLTATSIVGCAKDFTYNLTTVHPQPKAAFSTDKPAICIADDVVFTDLTDPTTGATTVTRYWDFTGSGTFISTTTPTITHTYSTVNTYAPTLYVVNSFGCHSDTLSQPFIVHPYPVVNAGKDRTILEFGSVKLDPTVTGEDLDYLWTPNIYFNNNNKIKQPTASLVKDDITYRLTVTSRGGCTATDEVFVKVLKFPQIPNTFTPNNDGINDFWRIEYLDSYPNCKVQVFNRTGQTVFESKGVYKSWDGTMKGKPLPFDTYYYVIEPGNGRDPVTGYVTIVK
jgi:gliding motility-associated-like protein